MTLKQWRNSAISMHPVFFTNLKELSEMMKKDKFQNGEPSLKGKVVAMLHQFSYFRNQISW